MWWSDICYSHGEAAENQATMFKGFYQLQDIHLNSIVLHEHKSLHFSINEDISIQRLG